jgi:tRNA C32,U32 (ribose-2'-O)-methylase TrmJ
MRENLEFRLKLSSAGHVTRATQNLEGTLLFMILLQQRLRETARIASCHADQLLAKDRIYKNVRLGP